MNKKTESPELSRRILIVEDDLPLLNALSTTAKRLGYSVTEALDGVEALTKFKKDPPDLVLLDIVLPIKNGYEVLDEIKNKEKSKIPVVVLSNLPENPKIGTGKASGPIEYIIKSNRNLKEIMASVEKAIERSK
jgi:CheY-like chemotaxis protein